MQARGRLRNLVSVQQSTKVDGEDGHWTNTWVTVGTRWASIEPLTGRELLQAQGQTADVTHRVRMDAYSGFKPNTFRLLTTDGETLSPVSVIDLTHRGVTMELMCKEEVGG